MGLLIPASLGFLALAIPIIIFYMLRLRRQPQTVSSLFLWQKVLQDRQANAPWQKLRRNLLLFLQLLILLLIVLALARPFQNVSARVQGNVIILLDASASMTATDVSPTRFDAARAEAARIIRNLRAGDSVSLIAVTDIPQPILSGFAVTDRIALETALSQIQPADTAANWESALALAAAGAASQPNTKLVILSDGAIPADLPVLPVPVRFIPIGQSDKNQGIVAMAIKENADAPELFVRVENFADTAAKQRLEILVDGALFDAKNLSLPPHPDGSQSLTLGNLPADSTRITAQLAIADNLPADNRATLRRNAQSTQILLAGQGNLFLERALSLLPNTQVFQSPAENLPTENHFDLMIFDRATPDTLPINTDSFLFIAPPKSTELFTLRDTFTPTTQINIANPNHPALAFVNLANTHIARAQSIDAPWATPLALSGENVLISAGESDGRRSAIIVFNLLQSDLPLQIDFPILISNLTRWLTRQSAIDTAPAPDTRNLLNAAESNIRPNQNQIIGSEKGNAESLAGQREFWWILAALALAVLTWEWWVFWRGNA